MTDVLLGVAMVVAVTAGFLFLGAWGWLIFAGTLALAALVTRLIYDA